MTCYHPITGWRSQAGRNPATGLWPIVFNRRDGYSDLEVQVPCGRCIGCRLERSRKWAMRCVHEASLYKDNCFITLTYDDFHLDPSGSLNVEDYQLFMKRLRKHFGSGVRFFHCGEYGELYGRPHHHAILFNCDFDDKELMFHNAKTGFNLYSSNLLGTLWPFGLHSIGNVSFESCAYVARYIMKKVTGDDANSHYHGRKPEYVTMSRRPGIGHDWICKYIDDVYPHDFVIIRNGIKCKPPAYYDNIYDSIMSNSNLSGIKYARKKYAIDHAVDNTPSRLAVKEECVSIKLDKLSRNLPV